VRVFLSFRCSKTDWRRLRVGRRLSSQGAVLLGRILVSGGAANSCFGSRGEMFILNEHQLWRAELGEHVRGALLRI
jgi:gluconolactonase